jgi:hypothetical protein
LSSGSSSVWRSAAVEAPARLGGDVASSATAPLGGGGAAGAAALGYAAPWVDAPAPAMDELPRPGAPLPAAVRADMEPRFGRDLSGVTLSTSSASAAAAAGLGARAITIGKDIHFAAGELDLSSAEGQKLLAHELTHTLQADGSGADSGVAADVSHPDDPAEREADAVAEEVTRTPRGAAPWTTPHISRSLAGVGRRKIHRAVSFSGAPYLDPERNVELDVAIPTLRDLVAAVNDASGKVAIDVDSGKPIAGCAAYQHQNGNPRIVVATLEGVDVDDPANALHPQVVQRAVAVCHELSHALDYHDTSPERAALRGALNQPRGEDDLLPDEAIHSEYLAHAHQVCAARQAKAVGVQLSSVDDALMNQWTADTFQRPEPSTMFDKTKAYLRQCRKLQASTDDETVRQFVRDHQDWVDEAFQICPAKDRAATNPSLLGTLFRIFTGKGS